MIMPEDGGSREYPGRPLVGVGVVVIKDGRILLVKRAFDPGAGKWSIPGGLVETGETLAAAGARECEEETGVKVQVLELINAFDMINLDEGGKVRYHYVLVDFLASQIGGEEKPNEEVSELKWATYEEAKNLDLTKTARKALAELFGASIT